MLHPLRRSRQAHPPGVDRRAEAEEPHQAAEARARGEEPLNAALLGQGEGPTVRPPGAGSLFFRLGRC